MTSKPARTLAVLAALVPALVPAITWATAAGTSASGEPSASSPAAAAVLAVTTRTAGAAAAAVPVDFGSVMGYRPRVRDGLLVDPHGGCSSPVPMPAAFTPACAEHDLGYDLLRYADLTGEPLGGWARTAIDRRLVQRMRSACALSTPGLRRALCSSAAYVATVVVGVNSVRQLRGVPEETAGSWAVTGAAVGAVAAAAAGSLARRRRDRGGSPRRMPAPAAPAVPA